MPIETSSEPNPALHSYSQEPAHKKRTWVRLLIYLVLACLVGVVVWRIHENQLQTAATSAAQAAALANRPTPVQVATVEQRPMPIYLSALGTVTPYMSVTVKARVSGELLPVKFTEGQQVRAGETILEIDPKPYQAALDQAKGTLAHDQALLKNAQAEYARYKALYEAGVVSKETVDVDEAAMGQYQGAIESDKAAIETATLELSWCSIQSPITGRIGLRLVDPGNIITANTTNLVVINQFQPIAVDFTLPENELPQVLKKLATDKQLGADAYDQGDTTKLASGKLLTADNQIDTTTGTDRLKAVFNNADNLLFPNQFVNIHLQMENRPAALVVPSAAVQSGSQGSYVWTTSANENGKLTAKMQIVKVALAQGQVTILDSGVTADQKVVTDGADRLKNGALVSVTETRQASSGASGASGGKASTANGGGAAGVFGASGGSQQPGGTGAGQGGRQGGSGSQKQGDKQ
jgi:multidrug efflux system membrane fusion protein